MGAGAHAANSSSDSGVATVLAYTWVTERENLAISSQWYGIDDTADAAAFTSGLRAALALSHSPDSCPGGS